jgi:asparagine synthase (glutamine-hydrolysing)
MQFGKSLTVAPPQTWRLAWGNVGIQPNAQWQNKQLAIFGTTTICWSKNQRFLVIGDAWLPGKPGNPLQSIANDWEDQGIALLTKLVGSFAIAIWDQELQELVIARDQSGAQTLHYTTSAVMRWISPSLRALQPYRSNDLNLIALRDYLCCSFVPGAHTMWQEVRELRPGSYWRLSEESPKAYWQPQEQITEPDLTLTDWGDRLRQLLQTVVQESLPHQQPVGVFLSGGLDSSCIAALMTRFHDQPVHSYSIHFGTKLPNELEFSSLVAAHCVTSHHILEIPLAEMWRRLPETMAVLEEPIGDPLTVPNLLLGQLAKQSVDVVLNGEGGDPCFGGSKNQPMLMHGLYKGQSEHLAAYLRSFQKCSLDLPQLLQPHIWQQVAMAESVFTTDLTADVDYLNRLMLLNIKFKGADQILTKVHNLTQAARLCGRSPLFDQRVVALSMAIPPTFKLNGVTEKAVLKQAVRDLLPAQIIQRPKSGMMVPVHIGFKDYWNRSARRLLLDKKAAISPYINSGLVKSWLDYRDDAWGRYGAKLWLLASLEYWLKSHQ